MTLAETTQCRTELLGAVALFPDNAAEAQASSPEILTKREAAQLARMSERTLDRLSEDGRGPVRIQLSARRVGYWKRDVLAWLAARTAPAKHKDAV